MSVAATTEFGRPAPRRGVPVLLLILIVGAAVALTLGVFGAAMGAPRDLPTWGFSSVQTFKAWLSSGVLALVAVQLATALWIFQRLPGQRGRAAPRWVHRMHRASGALAFLISLPVAFYCLYGFGFDASTPRTLVHSVAGCLFYGAFAAKMLALRSRRLPGWTLPVLGGVTFSVFVLAWTLSALWWFRLVGLTT
jgi:Family of unknown function (DUF6529)